MLKQLYSSMTEWVDRRIGWEKLPWPLGLLVVLGLRFRLRAKNLYDSGRGVLDVPPAGDEWHVDHLTARTIDGTYNDLDDPLMGAIGSRFGRNVPLDLRRRRSPARAEPAHRQPRAAHAHRVHPGDDAQPPRRRLDPVRGARLVQPRPERDREPLEDRSRRRRPVAAAPDGDPADAQGSEQRPERAGRHSSPPTRIGGTPRRSTAAIPTFARAIRSGEGGRLRITPQGLLPEEVEGHVDLRGVAGNFWIGLALLHALFMLEHNAICDRLHAEHPELDDQALYEKARLVNAALMAKIHTVDWTPAIIAHPTTIRGLRANWFGILGERFDKLFGRRTRLEFFHGIPGSKKELFGVPYSLTEEFVGVYRMHPLIPDDYAFRALADDRLLQQRTFDEVNALHVRECLEQVPLADALYSFGVAHPGAISLHNYPRSLQRFNRPDGEVLDLASIDILRTRERGVPRYNEFRRLFHMKAPETFEEMTGGDATLAAQLQQVYGDVELVDLMIGLFAEPKPAGFGFSDTAFRVFILMASRRLEADRFFTDDYRPEIYTKAGIDWVESNNMRTVILRHCPELAPSLEGVGNPFAPWNRASAPVGTNQPAAAAATA